MDVLAGYQARATAPLDEISTMLGYPGKMGMSGANVWDEYLAGNIEGIRNYCETDVLNTYLVYLRFESIRGNLSADVWKQEVAMLRKMLQEQGKQHLDEFVNAWR